MFIAFLSFFAFWRIVVIEDDQDIAVVEGNADLDSEQVLDDAELSSSDVEQEQIAEENQIQDVSEIEESDSQDEDVENIKENQNENATDYDDEAVQAKSGNMIIVAEGQEDEENPSKIDPNDQKEESSASSKTCSLSKSALPSTTAIS